MCLEGPTATLKKTAENAPVKRLRTSACSVARHRNLRSVSRITNSIGIQTIWCKNNLWV
jgi:hypothetical protein